MHRQYTGTITRAAATVSGSQAITGVGGKPKTVQFSAIDDGDANTCSDGSDNGSQAVSTRSTVGAVLLGQVSPTTKSHTQSIHIQNIGGDGHSANISSMDVDGFTLNWTKIANGRAITVKYTAIL